MGDTQQMSGEGWVGSACEGPGHSDTLGLTML